LLFVLGSARTGLIFTGIQEWTQPGGLTPPGQTDVLSCWVLVGGELGGGNSLAALELMAEAVRESGSLCCVVCLVYSPYLYF